LRAYPTNKLGSRRDYFKWLVIGLKVPRDGLGLARSLVFAEVREVLQSWLARPRWFALNCCYSSVLLAVLLAPMYREALLLL